MLSFLWARSNKCMPISLNLLQLSKICRSFGEIVAKFRSCFELCWPTVFSWSPHTRRVEKESILMQAWWPLKTPQHTVFIRRCESPTPRGIRRHLVSHTCWQVCRVGPHSSAESTPPAFVSGCMSAGRSFGITGDVLRSAEDCKFGILRLEEQK